MKKILMMDIDGVINDFNNQFTDFVNQNLVTNYSIHELFNENSNKVNYFMNKFDNKYSELNLFPEVNKNLTILRSFFDIIFVTARNYKRLGECTKWWMLMNHLGSYSVIHAKDKLNIYQEYEPDVVVDDELRNIWVWANRGNACFMPINERNVEDLKKVFSENIIKYNDFDDLTNKLRCLM